MKVCTCKPSRPHPSPLKKHCVKCGFNIDPRPKAGTPNADLIYHCARCTCDLHPGYTGGALYELDGGVALSMIRFCSDCIPYVIERAVTYD